LNLNSSKINNPVVLILAGGKGERFWPRSRESSPKQLQKVYSNKTLLRETIDRALSLTDISRIYIGTNNELKKSILKIEKKFPKNNFIIEPEGKNTAPIIALASLIFQKKYGDPIQVVLSADAYVNPLKEFTLNLKEAIYTAKEDNLVLLGVKPNRPEIGYGYISIGRDLSSGSKVSSFHEKPDLKNAIKFLKKKNFFWNPGIFVWKNSVILSEFEKYAPYIINPLKKSFPFKGGELQIVFNHLPTEAIDTAIMEKSSRIVMIKSTFQWDDVGSWVSLERVIQGDHNNNYHIGNKSYHFKSNGNISSSSKEMVVFLGVNDLILVEEDDVILLSSKKGIGDIKLLLSEFKKNKDLQKYLK